MYSFCVHFVIALKKADNLELKATKVINLRSKVDYFKIMRSALTATDWSLFLSRIINIK